MRRVHYRLRIRQRRLQPALFIILSVYDIGMKIGLAELGLGLFVTIIEGEHLMDLQALKSYLDGINQGSLTLDSADTSLPREFLTFLQSAPKSTINLQPSAGVGIRLDGSALSIDGACSEVWPIEGMNNHSVTLKKLNITINDDGASSGFLLTAEGTIPITASGSATVKLASPLNNNAGWTIELVSATGDLTPTEWMLFGLSGPLLCDIPSKLDVFDRALVIHKDSFKIEFFPHTTYDYRFSFGVSAPDARWEVVPDAFVIQGIDFKALLIGDSLGGKLIGRLQLAGLPVNVGVSLNIGPNWVAFIEPGQGETFPGLAALAGLIGGTGSSDAALTGFSDIGFPLDDFDLAISRVSVGFNWERDSLNFIEILSLLEIKNIKFQVLTRLPDLTIIGSLKEESPISIKDLVGSFDLDNRDIPDSLRVTAMRLAARPSSSFYAVNVTVDGIWALGSIGLNEVRLAISYFGGQHGKGFTGQFDCNLTIANADLWLSAEYAGNEVGWFFNGRTASDSELSIDDVIADLGAKFGVDAPASILGLSLKNLEVSYETGTGKFRFLCDGKFEVENTHVSAQIQIDIAPKQGRDSGQELSYESKFGGTITIGSNVFGLLFDHVDKSSEIFIATYHGDQSSLNARNLVENFSSEVAQLLPEDFAIALKDALFVFSKTGEEKKLLFGLDIGADISLSNLPLVGRAFPPNRTVGIEDLQVLVASTPFSVAEVKKLNGLLPAGVTKLPEVSQNAGAQNGSQDDTSTIVLKQGLNVGATLKLGDTTRNLSLPVVASGSPQTTVPPASTSQAVGAADNAAWFKIQKSLGPVHFERVGVQYKNAAIWFLLDTALSAAGLTLSLDGLSVGSPISRFEPQFDLRGLGIDYRNDALEIGGAFLKIAENEYAGSALIKAKQLTLSALGLYKEMADGHPSVFVYAVLDYPIGGPSFFYVTGLAAGFGYGRALKMPTIDKVASFSLVESARNGAKTPINVTEALKKMSNDITPAAGENFLAIGVKFTSFKIVESFALLTVSFGSHFEMNLLGLSSLVAPANAGPNVPPVAEAQLALKASFLPDKGFLGVQAQLTPNSYILSKDCHLTGGFAFYSWFEGSEHDGDFALTLGGYHPNFRVPAHYPTVPRLGFNWQVNPELSIKGDAYFALTASALMAGGHLEANWRSGSVHAWFKLGADFLIAWKPYHYEISAYVSIGAEVTFEFFGTQHISVDVGADLRIWGPEFSGEATIHLWIISFTVSFGAGASHSPQPIDWPTFKSSFLPADKDVCSITVTGGLIGKDAQDAQSDQDPQEPVDLGVINPKQFSLTTNSVIPSTKAQYALNVNEYQEISLSRTPGTFGIGSMEVSAGHLTSTQTITIKRDGDVVPEDDFEYTPIFKKVPAGLWGESLTPAVNGKQFVEDALSGFEIRPKMRSKPGETAAIERSKLQEDGFSGEVAYQWENVKTFAAAPFNSEQERRQKLRDSLAASATGRNTILSALGFTTDDMSKIALNAAQADDFLIAPQIEQI
jgi:hypothetical protein